MFSFSCAWINGWVKNREAGDWRRHRAHYDVTVMFKRFFFFWNDVNTKYDTRLGITDSKACAKFRCGSVGLSNHRPVAVLSIWWNGIWDWEAGEKVIPNNMTRGQSWERQPLPCSLWEWYVFHAAMSKLSDQEVWKAPHDSWSYLNLKLLVTKILKNGMYSLEATVTLTWRTADLFLISLRWRHNGPDGVSNHQPHGCLLTRLFRRRSKKTSKLRVTGLCMGNSPMTGEFPAQRASNAENVSIWWRHHMWITCTCIICACGEFVFNVGIQWRLPQTWVNNFEF